MLLLFLPYSCVTWYGSFTTFLASLMTSLSKSWTFYINIACANIPMCQMATESGGTESRRESAILLRGWKNSAVSPTFLPSYPCGWAWVRQSKRAIASRSAERVTLTLPRSPSRQFASRPLDEYQQPLSLRRLITPALAREERLRFPNKKTALLMLFSYRLFKVFDQVQNFYVDMVKNYQKTL